MKVNINISNLSKFISNISYVIINMTQILKPFHRFVTDFQQIFSKNISKLKNYFSQVCSNFSVFVKYSQNF